MSCDPTGLTLIGVAALFVALPLGFILWFVFAHTVNMNPPEEKL
jgi:hypothetical protein